jgi:hypothetical protein
MFSFPSHPLPLNEDYGKEFFPNNIFLKENEQMYRKISAKAKLQRMNFEVIKSFQSGKIPGLDGIPVEVYLIY